MSYPLRLQHETTLTNGFLTENQMFHLFNIFTANIERSRTPITICIISIDNKERLQKNKHYQIDETIGAFLQSKIRQSDMISKLSNPLEWCVMLTQSNEKDACGFIKRVLSDMNSLFSQHNINTVVSVAEVKTSDATYNEVLYSSQQLIKLSLNKTIVFNSQFKERKVERIKVSIIEENELFSQTLYTTLEHLSVDGFQLDIKKFQDGYEFLQSDWYHTSHAHVILVNDILSRTTGLEVVHRIRELPNNRKFIIYMMTTRKSDDDMMHAFESGIDDYLVKPFSIRLFEAQMKRVLERLWS